MLDSMESDSWWSQRVSDLHDHLQRTEKARFCLPLCGAAQEFEKSGSAILSLVNPSSNVAQVRQAELILARRFRLAYQNLDERHQRRCTRTNRCLVDVYIQLSIVLEELELRVNLPAPLVTDYDRVVRQINRLERGRPTKGLPPSDLRVSLFGESNGFADLESAIRS